MLTNEARYAGLWDALPHLAAIVDSRLRLLRTNARARGYAGWPSVPSDRFRVLGLVHRHDRRFELAARTAIEAETEFACELRLRRADGTYVRHRVHAVPLTDHPRSGRQWLLTATAIEDHGGAAMPAAQPVDDGTRIGSFAFRARLGHDVRTPLNGIVGFTTLLLDGELLPGQRRYVKLLREAGRSLLTSFNDLLDPPSLEAQAEGFIGWPATDASSPDDVAAVPRSAFAPRHILVADDNGVNQIVAQSLLARDGHEVVLAGNGAQAVEAAATGRFDLILMDMQMPVMDGLDATRAIRALPGRPGEVPIVALTANTLPEQVGLCRRAGMNDHLAKPIDRELLRRAVAYWTSDIQSRRSAPAPSQRERQPAVSDAVTVPVLDIAWLLEIFDGDSAAVDELLDAAIASMVIDVARIRQAAELDDMAEVAEAAHRLKGTSGSVRSEAIPQLSAAIEAAAKASSRALRAVNVADIERLGAAVAAFRAGLADYRHARDAHR